MNKKSQIIFENGLVEFRQNKYTEAIQHFKSAYQLSLQKNNFSGAGAALNKIGEAYMLSQQFRLALNHLLKAFVLRSDHNDKVGLLETLNSLGEIHYYLDSFNKSMYYYEKCLSQSRVLKNDYYIALALKNVGWIKFKTDKSFSSISSDYAIAVSIAEEIQEKRLLLSCYDNLGDLHFSRKDFVSSLQFFNKMLHISNATEYTHMTIRALKNIGNVHREMGDLKAAESFLIRAMNLAKEKNILAMLRDCSYDKALLHEQKKEFRVAYSHFKNYHGYAMEIEKEKSSRQMADALQIETSGSPMNIHESLKIPNLVGITEEFRNSLLKKYPQLTPRQVEIVSLIRSGISSKEISILLNIEVDSINKQRARIRKSFDINRTQNLMTFLQKFAI